MALGLTQFITEMSMRDLPAGRGGGRDKAGPALKVDNPIAICEPIV
jgi:hypothetical protein